MQYRCRSILSTTDSTIAAGDEEGRIRAWDVLTGKERPFSHASTAGKHSKAVLWLEATEKEGGRMVSAGADGVVKVWGRRALE